MKKAFIFTLGTIFCFLIFISYLFFTSQGLNALFKLSLLKYAEPENIIIEQTSGNLLQGVRFKNVLIKGIKNIPLQLRIKIQEADFFFPDLNLLNLSLKITNAKLEWPNGGAIFFHGVYKNKQSDFNIYANRIDLGQGLGLLIQKIFRKNVSGVIIEPDLFLSGAWPKVKLGGKFIIQAASYKGVTLKDCPVSLSGAFNNEKNELKAWGEIILGEGRLAVKNTNIKVEKGKIVFSGKVKNPAFDIEGSSFIGETKIYIVLRGTLDKPDLKLSSEPPMPQDVLLLLLATGKPWEGVEKSFLSGTLNPGLIKDFIDYFFLGGSAEKFAKSFGINDISLTYDKGAKGIKATTSISEKLGISYGIEEKGRQDGSAVKAQQNVGAEFKVTDSVSIEAEKQIKQQDKPASGDSVQQNDKILLKYKKKF